tara:strand:+ start:11615 stop:13666 length:2052 start_codon:yes stop_codon:yes gene_type:complete
MEIKKNFTIIIQARVESTRFEGKILKKIINLTYLEILIKRLKKAKKINKIVVACTNSSKDKQIIKICKKLKINVFSGSTNNVLKRFFDVATKYKLKNIIRITADCPLIDPVILDKMISSFEEKKVDYLSNISPPTFPDGLDIEIFNYKSLYIANREAKSIFDKEHVTPYIKRSKLFRKYNYKFYEDYSFLRLTLDEENDHKVLTQVFNNFKSNIYFSINDIVKLYKNNEKIFAINKNIIRNEGSRIGIGQKFWKRANKIIPGGTMLFSKNPNLHLPSKWPAYFSKTKGCKIWDLDGKVYNDIFLMGVGTNTLGYSNYILDKKINKVIKDGTMSSLNSIEEIYLAEKLIELHPWADMARFTRSGGEANSVAIRIARAYSGKDNVAICGYHGWHDWYLSSNLSYKSNLDNFLIKDLSVKGVPKRLINTVFPFEYNNYEKLKKIVNQKNIGVIKMEVERNEKPKNNFLNKVRELANKKNIILIFDECTSGFRKNYGGIHMDYEVYPDIAIFGKALGNGYAINAVIGKKDIMEACNSTFISSTFWTERIGSVAGLETLKIMESIKSWEIISKIGKKIKKKWAELAKINSLNIKIQGIDALPNFYFNYKNNNAYKTFISQEMIKRNILASNVIYTCIFHNKKVLDKYFSILNEVFKKINKCENDYENIYNLLETKESILGLREKDTNV